MIPYRARLVQHCPYIPGMSNVQWKVCSADLPYQQHDTRHTTPAGATTSQNLSANFINTLVCMSNCYISIKTDLQTSNNNDVIVHHVSSDRAAITNIKQKQFFIFGQ